MDRSDGSSGPVNQRNGRCGALRHLQVPTPHHRRLFPILDINVE
jgi:hypothetical protein